MVIVQLLIRYDVLTMLVEKGDNRVQQRKWHTHKGTLMILSWFIVLGACFIASTLATISGFGVSTILTPTLLFFFPLKEVILLVCIVHIFHDLGKLFFFYRAIDYTLVVGFGGASVVAALVSSLFVAWWHAFDLSVVFGVFLLIYALLLLWNPHIQLPKNWLTLGSAGLITGFIAGIFGIVGAIRSLFLISFKISKQEYVGTSGLLSGVVNVTRIIAYSVGGMILARQELLLLPFLIGITIIGTVCGSLLVDKIPTTIFRNIVLIFIVATAVRLIATPFF